MNQFTKEIVSALAQRQDLDIIFKDQLETAVNELLQNERAAIAIQNLKTQLIELKKQI